MNRKGLSPVELLLTIMAIGALALVLIYWFTMVPMNAPSNNPNPTPTVSPSATPSPTASSTPDATGMHCGGFIANAPTCPSGYHCLLGVGGGHNPDTGGVCAPDEASSSGAAQ